MSFGYFWDGFNHFLFGLLFIFLFFKLSGRKEGFTWKLWLGLIIGSSSLFFLPSNLPTLSKSANYWYQFFHYPLSDWDILLVGMHWHRSFLTHSIALPLLLMKIPAKNRRLSMFILGLTVGVASHLAWDGYSSANPMIVFYPKVIYIKGFYAKAWLYINSVGLIFLALKINIHPPEMWRFHAEEGEKTHDFQ